MHLIRTSTPSMRFRAELYNFFGVRLLISLSGICTPDGFAPAAVRLLRSYKMSAEEFDPNRHLSGAHALAAGQAVDSLIPSKSRAEFSNYHREDITFSLITRRSLKIDLNCIGTEYTPATDEDQLNLATLRLAQVMNVAFGGHMSMDDRDALDKTWRCGMKHCQTDFSPILSP